MLWRARGTSGETGRRSGLKIRGPFGGLYGFDSRLVHGSSLLGPTGLTRLGGDPLPELRPNGYPLRVSTPLDGFNAALTIQSDRLAGLEAGLAALEPLGKVALHASAEDPTVVALLDFGSAGGATVRQPRLRRLAEELGGTLFNLGSIDEVARKRLASLTERLTVRGTSPQGASAAFTELAQRATVPLLQLHFDDLDALFTAWARAVAEGALWIPTRRPPIGARYRLAFVVGDTRLGGTGRLLEDRPPRTGEQGFWLEPTPSPEFSELFAKRVRERHAGRPANAPPPGVVRKDQRFETMLEVRFDDMPALAAQWASDISHGGLFIHCPAPPELRAKVAVHLRLPSGQEVTLGAEVVHRILSGGRPGVGVQFTDRSPEALAPIVALMEDYRRRQPRVLVVDDEAIWRSTLARALGSLGCDVQLACDGKEGLLKLIDGYFDLDLVILDLHMPNLDGRGLIERIRKHGGESGLKLFLFSAAPPEELAALGDPGLATGVFSKLDSIDALTARIARELGLSVPGLPRASSATAHAG